MCVQKVDANIKKKWSCSAQCHPGHSCTNGEHRKSLCKMDLAAELNEDDEDDKDTGVNICTVKLTTYHKAIFASPKSWQDDLIIAAAQYMYMWKQQHPSIHGFQPPALPEFVYDSTTGAVCTNHK